jgi:D-arabinose 1-dehydrogenase-like Zn-dependent alcohol dehydrogenase
MRTNSACIIATVQLRIQGNNTGPVADLAESLRAITGAGIKPVIDHRFGLDESVAAFERLEAGRHFGKLTISI